MQRYLWYFFVYAFLGWCAEVVFAALGKGRFVNRGFLNGPVCPIYGVGLVTVLWCLTPLAGNLLWLYLGSVLLTTALELITGFLMEELFHQRWWDYSKMPLNIGGYVCPLFSLIWGVACVLIVDVLHPHVESLIQRIPEPLGTVLLALFCGILLTDIVVTVATVARLNRRLRQIDDIAASLRKLSDGLGMAMADGALAVKATDEYACEELQAAGERTRDTLLEADERARAELKARQDALLQKLGIGQRRLISAFPQLRSLRHPAALDALRQRLNHLRDLKKKRRKGA